MIFVCPLCFASHTWFFLHWEAQAHTGATGNKKTCKETLIITSCCHTSKLSDIRLFHPCMVPRTWIIEVKTFTLNNFSTTYFMDVFTSLMRVVGIKMVLKQAIKTFLMQLQCAHLKNLIQWGKKLKILLDKPTLHNQNSVFPEN